MHVLFIHQAFPAQFGRLALELARGSGWRCTFLVESLSRCPGPSAEMLERLEIHPWPADAEGRNGPPAPWPQHFGAYLEQCERVADAVAARPELRPDLVVGHGGRGAPTLFLPEEVDCPIVNYCEYYFAARGSDLSYRLDLPPAEDVELFFPRCINAPVLVGLDAADSGYSATRWQRDSFPARHRPRIEVHFDGIDTALYRPRPAPRRIGGRSIPEGTRVVTYVARGLESMRGFDLFLEAAARIARERADVLFVVVGSDAVYYGWDALRTGGLTFKEWALRRTLIPDSGRFLFLDQIEPEALSEVLALSDLHFYLTVPFVLSWSLLNAMASGCVVLGSDVPPVREVIEPGRTGLVEPLFDADRLVDTAFRVLDDPAEFRPLAESARDLMLGRYSLEVCIPELKTYFERVASAGRTRGRGPPDAA